MPLWTANILNIICFIVFTLCAYVIFSWIIWGQVYIQLGPLPQVLLKIGVFPHITTLNSSASWFYINTVFFSTAPSVLQAVSDLTGLSLALPPPVQGPVGGQGSHFTVSFYPELHSLSLSSVTTTFLRNTAFSSPPPTSLFLCHESSAFCVRQIFPHDETFSARSLKFSSDLDLQWS